MHLSERRRHQKAKIFTAGKMLAGAATAPGERIKVLLATGQLNDGWSAWAHTLRVLLRAEGVGTFWRGNTRRVCSRGRQVRDV